MPENVQPESSQSPTPVPSSTPVSTGAPPAAAELAVQDARALAMQAQQRLLTSHFGMQVQVGPAPNELLAKLDSTHITKVIEVTADEQKRSHERKVIALRGSLIGGINGFLVLCWIFLHYDKPELLKDILLLFTGLVGGFLGGLGIGKVIKKD